MESNRNIGEQPVLSQTKVDKITSKINPKVFAKVAEFSSKIPPTMKSIGVLCSMFSGGTPSAGRVEYYNNGTIPFIRSGEINSETTELFLTEKGLANSAAKLVEKGDLLLALYGATSGEVGISKISGAINQAVLCIRSSQLNTLYLKNLLIFEKARILNTYLQGGQGNLSAEIIKSLKFPFPPLAEQKRIAEVLSIWDEGIERLERVIALKEKRKRALMQRLLSGKTRFSGFSAPWKEMRLGDLGNIVSGGTPSTNVEAYWGGNISWITPSEVSQLDSRYVAKTERTITSEGMRNSSATLLPQNSLIVCTRATVGYCCVNTIPMCTNQGFKSIIPWSNVDVEFLYYSVSAKKKDLLRKASGSTFLEVSKKDFDNIYLFLPELKEQRAIRSVLCLADDELSLLRRKCELLKSQKKWLMQQLLTGKKRLVK